MWSPDKYGGGSPECDAVAGRYIVSCFIGKLAAGWWNSPGKWAILKKAGKGLENDVRKLKEIHKFNF